MDRRRPHRWLPVAVVVALVGASTASASAATPVSRSAPPRAATPVAVAGSGASDASPGTGRAARRQPADRSIDPVATRLGRAPADEAGPAARVAVRERAPIVLPQAVDDRAPDSFDVRVVRARYEAKVLPKSVVRRVVTVASPSGGSTAPAESNARGASQRTAAPAPARAAAPPPAPAYSGRNQMWVPALGMSGSVAWFPCSRTTPPDHLIYRWGCAGANNVYLMGHAASVFAPLHNAYVAGRLQTGMKVIYADDAGRVRTYAVSFWKVVRPDGDVAWAYAGQGSPSMTLQTCVGAGDSFRLVVRLVAVE